MILDLGAQQFLHFEATLNLVKDRINIIGDLLGDSDDLLDDGDDLLGDGGPEALPSFDYGSSMQLLKK